MFSSLRDFITDLEQNDCVYHFIDPIPTPKEQHGPSCGYYAASYVTDFYHLCDPGYPTKPARKKDTEPRSLISYRQLGKSAGIPGIGSIWDVNQFQLFLHDYRVDTLSFDSHKTMSAILVTNLHLNKPVVITVDMAHNKNGTKIIGLGSGQYPHYITIIGYYKMKDDDRLFYIFNTWKQFQLVSEDNLFDSSNNLQMFPGRKEFKLPKGDWCTLTPHLEVAIQHKEKKIFEMPKIDLSNLRNRCVLIRPSLFNEIAHYSKALQNILAKKSINFEIVKLLLNSGAQMNNSSQTLSTQLNSNMSDFELKRSIETLKQSKTVTKKRERDATGKELNDELINVFVLPGTSPSITPKTPEIEISDACEPQHKKIKRETDLVPPPSPVIPRRSLQNTTHLFANDFKTNTAILDALKRSNGKLTSIHFAMLAPQCIANFTQDHSDVLIYLIEEEKISPHNALKKLFSCNVIQYKASMQSHLRARVQAK